jgi:hypothetical protein
MRLPAKFVLTLRTGTTKKKAMEDFERFERDLGWRVFHAGKKQDFIKSKYMLNPQDKHHFLFLKLILEWTPS